MTTVCGRSSFAFNEHNLAGLRKIMATGPLPLWSLAAATVRVDVEQRKQLGATSVPRAARRAAVLVPLCNCHGVASMLFTVRTSKVSTHKGQVSFPGGHIDAGEDAVAAALRETQEEIGDKLGEIEVLGLCQTLPAVTGTPVTPVLAFVHHDVGALLHDLDLSPDEVDSVFILSVGDLLDPSFRVVDDLGLRGKLPAFTAGPSKVWGLTAAIAEGVLQRGIVPLLKDSPSAADDAGSEPREATPNSAL
ncbi:unnamed protein product [Ascophyllum nodosum]